MIVKTSIRTVSESVVLPYGFVSKDLGFYGDRNVAHLFTQLPNHDVFSKSIKDLLYLLYL